MGLPLNVGPGKHVHRVDEWVPLPLPPRNLLRKYSRRVILGLGGSDRARTYIFNNPQLA